MAAHRWLTSVIALCACLSVTAAAAATKKRTRAEAPVARGCSHPIPPYCMGVTSGKTTYALFDANPFIPPGTGVTVWGRVTGVSPCGTAISVTRWQRNKLKCRA
jgi:hypothetical protein